MPCGEAEPPKPLPFQVASQSGHEDANQHPVLLFAGDFKESGTSAVRSFQANWAIVVITIISAILLV